MGSLYNKTVRGKNLVTQSLEVSSSYCRKWCPWWGTTAARWVACRPPSRGSSGSGFSGGPWPRPPMWRPLSSESRMTGILRWYGWFIIRLASNLLQKISSVRICIVKFGSRSECRYTYPDPGHINEQKPALHLYNFLLSFFNFFVSYIKYL